MARIRTVKPEFFRHYGLYQIEVKAKMPIRLAFEGLWTAADREGRFKWNPEALKLDCLPYDKVDFSKTLDILRDNGFIIQYQVNGSVYGYIPTWHLHQCPNAHEAKSKLPEPDESNCICMHMHAPDGREKEGKGKEGSIGNAHAKACASTPTPDHFSIGDDLKEWASTNVPSLDVEAETEKFLDHHRSKGNKFKDWNSAWRKWMRNAAEWGKARTNGSRGKVPKDDILDRKLAEAEAEEQERQHRHG